MKPRYLLYAFTALLILAISSCSKDGPAGEMSSDTTGKGGSMARFTIVDQHLYVIDDRQLKVFEISDPDDPQFVKTVDIGFGIETIFPYGRHIFIGSNTGMFIYNIDVPGNPVFVADFEHVLSCDPVVVEDSIAYVTLRSGGTCRWGWTPNTLDIIDIHDIHNPDFINSVTVDEPWGLGADGDYLFICHGTGGIGIYNISNPLNVGSPFETITGLTTYDVIPNNGILLVIGPSGFYQYDYTDINDIKLLSSILIGN